MSQVISTAQRSLAQTGVQVQKLFAELPKAVDTMLTEIQANANTLADQEEALEAGRKAIDTQAREAAVELRLRASEDGDKVLNELLDARGLITTTDADVEALERRAEEAEAKARNTEFVAVKAAVAEVTAKYETRLSTLTADNKVAIAQYEAKATSDATTIKLLTEQLAKADKSLEDERAARVAMAEHASKAAGVVVNSGK